MMLWLLRRYLLHLPPLVAQRCCSSYRDAELSRLPNTDGLIGRLSRDRGCEAHRQIRTVAGDCSAAILLTVTEKSAPLSAALVAGVV